MAQILLLNPTYRGRASNICMPSGLLCVAAVLKANGHGVKIVDSHFHQYSPREALQAISGMDFDILGIGGISTSYYFWKEFVPSFRQKYGNSIPIMAGGSVATTMPETLLTYVDVDAICTGDAEPVVAELTEHLVKRQPLDELGGIAYRQGDKLVIKPGLRVKDMDAEVPVPPYDLIDVNHYRRTIPRESTNRQYISQYIDAERALEFMLFSSRGCPFNCFFCSRNFGRQFVQHSADKFIEHIDFVSREFSPDLFYFGDELLTTRRDWIVEFCGKYKAAGLGIPYRINARVDTVDRELLTILKDSGCYELDLGIESGSSAILKEMNKGVTVEQNREAMRLCKENGLYASPTMVFGMPSETIETIEETKSFLIEEDVRTFGSFFATAYPASALFEYAVSKGMIQNIDEYMLKADNADKLIINYTALSDDTLRRKMSEVAKAVLYAWYRRRGRGTWRLKSRFGLHYMKIGISVLLKEGPVSLINRAVKKVRS